MDGSANPQAAAAMGLHLLVLAKLNLITATAAHGGASPLVAGLLVWPFVLRLSFSIRPLHQAYTDLVYASRLFFFQMGQIAFSNGSTTAGPGIGNGDSSRTRWARALRLAYRRIIDARWSPVSDSDEENLRAVSVHPPRCLFLAVNLLPTSFLSALIVPPATTRGSVVSMLLCVSRGDFVLVAYCGSPAVLEGDGTDHRLWNLVVLFAALFGFSNGGCSPGFDCWRSGVGSGMWCLCSG
ncbi:hypothetical protein RHSIM_Rhsim07G0108300 [Rhododendron simsii]|uniref:Uncharacterized protein n=1 Tax=Rhododendron simsii TaxID=118357 RepID=A0A834GRG7_RHOSS|nr:hypothetical protein RHSIM_Rhsim07G0108300 [Rhododendron simsii]